MDVWLLFKVGKCGCSLDRQRDVLLGVFDSFDKAVAEREAQPPNALGLRNEFYIENRSVK